MPDESTTVSIRVKRPGGQSSAFLEGQPGPPWGMPAGIPGLSGVVGQKSWYAFKSSRCDWCMSTAFISSIASRDSSVIPARMPTQGS